jgi:methionine-S-sulfoxide reductase
MIKKIILAGGCFWGLQELIRSQNGVVDTVVGYTGGNIENPTYQNHDGHAEAVEISYEDEKTSYKKLLDFFFQIHNPTTLNQQGNDKGTSYRSAIFYGNEEEFVLDSKKSVMMPPGILHTYVALEDDTRLQVVCNTLFDPNDVRTHDTYSQEDFKRIQSIKPNL